MKSIKLDISKSFDKLSNEEKQLITLLEEWLSSVEEDSKDEE
jgi:hypothetical protein